MRLQLEPLEPRNAPSVVMQPDTAALVAPRPGWSSVESKLIGPHTAVLGTVSLDYLKQWYTPDDPYTGSPWPYRIPASLAGPQTQYNMPPAVNLAAAMPTIDPLAVDVLLSLPGGADG